MRGARSRRTRSINDRVSSLGSTPRLLRQAGLEALEEGERPSPVAGQ